MCSSKLYCYRIDNCKSALDVTCSISTTISIAFSHDGKDTSMTRAVCSVTVQSLTCCLVTMRVMVEAPKKMKVDLTRTQEFDGSHTTDMQGTGAMDHDHINIENAFSTKLSQ
jgi:hypothetical protein